MIAVRLEAAGKGRSLDFADSQLFDELVVYAEGKDELDQFFKVLDERYSQGKPKKIPEDTDPWFEKSLQKSGFAKVLGEFLASRFDKMLRSKTRSHMDKSKSLQKFDRLGKPAP